MNAKIRLYKDTDKEELRKIATSTASGYPRSDIQLVADLLTDYYINYEPGHLLVAESEGQLVGYLAGCFDTSRCRWIKATRVVPRAIVKASFRREIGLREIRYLGSFLYITFRGGTRNNPPSGYPAHFHVNVVESSRGMGIGTKLVRKFLSNLTEANKGGVHVRVRQNDRRASRFFKSFGFSRQNGYPIVVADEMGFRTSQSIIYTKKL